MDESVSESVSDSEEFEEEFVESEFEEFEEVLDIFVSEFDESDLGAIIVRFLNVLKNRTGVLDMFVDGGFIAEIFARCCTLGVFLNIRFGFVTSGWVLEVFLSPSIYLSGTKIDPPNSLKHTKNASNIPYSRLDIARRTDRG